MDIFLAIIVVGVWIAISVVALKKAYQGRLRPIPGPKMAIDNTPNTTAAPIQPHERLSGGPLSAAGTLCRPRASDRSPIGSNSDWGAALYQTVPSPCGSNTAVAQAIAPALNQAAKAINLALPGGSAKRTIRARRSRETNTETRAPAPTRQ
jgi:hypothetical protein